MDERRVPASVIPGLRTTTEDSERMNFFNRGSNGKKPNYNEITVDEYKQQFDDDNGHSVIDVREVMEYANGHLPGAVNIPLSEITNRTDEIPDDKPVILVCNSGNRSGMAASALARAGFENLYNLKGGTITWMRKGLEIEQ